MQPAASITRWGCEVGGTAPMVTMRPVAIATSARSSRPLAGSISAAVLDQELHASFPAMMDITAMRTAMPKVTCGRITLCCRRPRWSRSPRRG
jgi:hypothetical protein